MVVGVGGRLCSGKDTVISLMKKHVSFFEIDVDRLGHAALKECRDRVADVFGESILDEQGDIDRKKLGTLVFSDPSQRLKLESIVHPVMRAEVARQIDTQAGSPVIVNAALLFYMNLHPFCDTAVWVTAPERIRIRRLMERNSLSRNEALQRIHAQRHLKPQKNAPGVDIYKVENSGTLDELEERVVAILKNKELV